LTLTGTIRTQGGYIKGFGGTDQSDYILGSVSGAYGNPGITMGAQLRLRLIAMAAISSYMPKARPLLPRIQMEPSICKVGLHWIRARAHLC